MEDNRGPDMTGGEASVEVLREHGLSSHERGDLRAAEAAYWSILQRRPNDVEVKYALGVLALQTNRYGLGAELLSTVVGASETAAGRVYLGNALAGLSRSAEALENYERAIELDPGYAPAYINRGHALRGAGRRSEALASYDRATDIDPRFFEALVSRAELLRELNDPARALEAYDRAIDARPGDASVHVARASLLLDVGDPRAALSSIEKAIQLGADTPEAHTTRGLAQVRLEQRESALESFAHAIALKPDYLPAYINRAAMLRQIGRLEEAFEAQATALTLEPNSFAALANRAALLVDMARHQEALSTCEHAAACWPDRENELLCHRAAALLGLDRCEEARLVYERAIASRSDDAQAHLGRAAALQALQRYEEALEECDRAISLAPQLADAHFGRGHALTELKRIDEAMRSHQEASALRPDQGKVSFALGCLHLLKGDYELGWELYERRPRLNNILRLRGLGEPRWRGDQDLSGKSLFVYTDQGLGDAIQFARYARLAESRGARVILAVQARLQGLMSRLSPTIQIIGEEESPERFDFHCPLSSLAGAFRTTLHTIPAAEPYLHVEPQRVEYWRQRIGQHGFKIGICWQGMQSAAGSGRSFPLAELEAIGAMSGVRLVSLQKRDGLEQLATLPPGMSVEILGADEADSFLDAAAVMQCMDLVITCDTSIAHLAGALGRPAWVALKYVPDWRWMLDRNDSPWYPTLRLFRQTTTGSWREVFGAIQRELVTRRF